MTMTYETITLEKRGRVALITFNRPKALNALNLKLAHEVVSCAEACDADPDVGCIVLTGSEKAFAAGADIKEMQDKSAIDMYATNHFADWDRLAGVRKPVIAAVAGFALGGGCEVAMMCDFIIAADTAKFGQPEIKLGVTPGMGGSQRLTRLVGRSKAMDMCLTGRMMDAAEAERAGLVSRVVPAARLIDESRRRSRLDRGRALRAARVPLDVRHRRPEGRHGSVLGKKKSQLQTRLRAWKPQRD